MKGRINRGSAYVSHGGGKPGRKEGWRYRRNDEKRTKKDPTRNEEKR